MKTYEVTVWGEDGEQPHVQRYDAPTSIDALLRALGTVRESGCITAHVRLLKVHDLMYPPARGTVAP